MGLSSYRERCDCPRARVREENIDVIMFVFHDSIEPVQIFQARHIAHDRRNVSLDEGCGLLQLFLSSPSDHDVRTFFHEALGGGQANPAASACDNRNFSRQFLSMVITHMFSPFCFSLFFMLNLRSSSKANIVIDYCSFLNKSWKMSRPQVWPRACTSAPPSLNFPSLTDANPSFLAKSATGAIASSSSLERKTTRWPPSTTGSVARVAATR